MKEFKKKKDLLEKQMRGQEGKKDDIKLHMMNYYKTKK